MDVRHNKRSRRGFTLIEILVSGLIMSLLGIGLWTLLRSTYDSQYEVLGQNSANLYSRQVVDELADNLRGSTGITGAASSDISFTDNNNNTIRYYRAESSLMKTTNGLNAQVIATNVQSISFIYWTQLNGSWAYSTGLSSPSGVKAVDFTVKAVVNGCTRQISGSVRLRQK